MIIIYIAGPFTAPDSWSREQNIRRAEEAGMTVASYGAMPLIPHANARFFEGTLNPKFWYDGTLELLRRCDAVYCVDGYKLSTGTQREIFEATRLHLPVFLPEQQNDLIDWIESRK